MADTLKIILGFGLFVLFMVLLTLISHAIDRFFELVRIAERIEILLRKTHG